MLRHILAIDHGSSGCKVAAISIHGEVSDFEFEPTPTFYLDGGGVEQDSEDWWRGIVLCTRRILAKGKVSASSIAAVSVSSTWATTVCVDREGRPLMRALSWMDSRGAPYIKKVFAGFPSVSGYRLDLALDFIRISGGGPTLSGKEDIAHLLLVKEEFPEIYARVWKFLPSKDYINLCLTGEYALTYDSSMLFWVTDTRDMRHPRYSGSLARKLGVDLDKLPDLVASTDLVGELTAAAAGELGLGPGVKVYGGSPDHQAALLGSGAVRDYEGHLYIGTSSWVECIVPFKKTDMFHSITSMPSSMPGKYQCINEQDIAAGSLSFMIENILLHNGRLAPTRPVGDLYALLSEIAGGVPAGSNGVLFTPWLNGEKTPVDNASLRGGIHNMSLRTNSDDIVRSILEGVALNTRWSFRYVERFAGKRMGSLRIIGGGAKSDIWCQIFADVLDRTILRSPEPVQANARGAAFIAAVGLGEISFDDIPALVKVERSFEPTVAHHALYDELFEVFLEVYRRNRSLYKRINDVPQVV